MAENLNKVNMTAVYIFMFFTLFAVVKSEQEHIPVLVWTSPDLQNKKEVDYLAFNEINSDVFEFYFLELLGDKTPAVVVFLEQVLGIEDFGRRDENGEGVFPFLTQLNATSKVDFFRKIENPYQALARFPKNGHTWENLKPGHKFVGKEGTVFLVEFGKADEDRGATLKSHNNAIEKITQQLMASGKSWICVFTGRHNTGTFPDKLSPWYVNEGALTKPTKAICMYHDEHTGFALLTRGFIELHFPSSSNPVYLPLDNYLRASATYFQRKINFVIWFLNYKVTFHITQENHEWIIQEAKIMNDNGGTLTLTKQNVTENKCYTHVAGFKSKHEPMVEVKLSKYKFLKLPQQESCVKPYAVELMAIFIFFLVVVIAVFWNTVLESFDFSESKIPHKIVAFNLDRISVL